jgi:hypothetical protein
MTFTSGSGNSFQVVRNLAATEPNPKVLESCQMGQLKEAHANNDKFSAVRIGGRHRGVSVLQRPRATGQRDLRPV